MSDEQYVESVSKSMAEVAPHLPTQGTAWEGFSGLLRYVRRAQDYQEGVSCLKKSLEQIDSLVGAGGNYLFYLSVPPFVVSEYAEWLSRVGLAQDETGRGWRRVVVEKPFGTDLASARALNSSLRQVLAEDQIYRIDHYLGKETVQNILVFRFANQFIEPLMNSRYVDHIQVTVAETLGVEKRGGYYDSTGALRDMIQNHVLQVLSLVTMEPPSSVNAESIRDEKAKLLEEHPDNQRVRCEALRGSRAVCVGQADG